MGYVVRMPQLGMSMEEGTVVEWTITEEEAVEAGTEVAVVESEKSTAEIEARESGVLRRILVAEGETVEPGDPIGVIAGADETLEQYLAGLDVPDAAPADDGDDTSDTSTGTPSRADAAGTETDVRATPGARKLARQESVALAAVHGTGPQGVITEDDVRTHLETVETPAHPTRTVTDARALSGMQRTIRERLTESYRNAVHVTLNRSVETTALSATSEAAREADAELSITDLLLKAVSETLEAHPEFNALFEDDEHRLIEEINLGIAVDVDGGLVTPVIADVASSSAEAVSERRRELTERVRNGDFTADDLRGGTFTVSNLGHFGIDHFDPIIDPPQVAILGVGRIREDGSMTLSLSFDHRVLNGADAARFLGTLAETVTDESALAAFCETEIDATSDRRAEESRKIRVENPSGVSGTYTVDGTDTEVPFDEPTTAGGTGLAPTPIEHLLGALGSCLSLALRTMAGRDEIAIDGIDCDVYGTPSEGPLEAVDVELRIDSDAERELLERAVTKAARACYVERSLSEGIDVSVTWTRAD